MSANLDPLASDDDFLGEAARLRPYFRGDLTKPPLALAVGDVISRFGEPLTVASEPRADRDVAGVRPVFTMRREDGSEMSLAFGPAPRTVIASGLGGAA